MFFLRCTKKLLGRLPPSEVKPIEQRESTTGLGDWTAHLFIIRRQQIVLGVNNRTLLPVLLPVAPNKTLIPRFVEAAGEMLMAIGSERTAVLAEMTAMGECIAAPTNDRRVLGTINDFGRALDFYVDGCPLPEVALHLAETPCSPIGMERPRDVARQLFSLPTLRLLKVNVAATRKPRTVDARTRTAYHESGHAVLSAAINDTPRHVSIRPNGDTLGRSGARMSARSTSLVQVHLAGFAAEHVLTSRRPRQLDQEIGFALIARSDVGLRKAFAGSEHHDGYRAVQEVLRMGTHEDDDKIKREVDRFYEIARESLSAVWSAVKAMAIGLQERGELDREDVERVLEPFELFSSVLRVQQAHGLLLGSKGPPR